MKKDCVYFTREILKKQKSGCNCKGGYGISIIDKFFTQCVLFGMVEEKVCDICKKYRQKPV